MKARFLADADLHPGIADGLRRRNPAINFQNALGIIREGTLDPQVLALAAESHRVLVSHDFRTMPRHFREFTRKLWSPGLILIPQRLSIGSAIEELLLVWECHEEREFENSLLYLPL